jgi:biotin synthase
MLTTIESNRSTQWADLAGRILGGRQISRDEALSVLNAPDEDVPALLEAAYEIRRRYFGNSVKLYYLINAKSGICAEDCKYCSQSKMSSAPVEKYAWLSIDEILKGAQRAYDLKACTYCIVGSGRGPTDREVEHVVAAVKEIKAKYPLDLCACMGLLKPHQAVRLAEAGVDRFNHNLNTSEEYHDEICETHTFKDRWANIELLKSTGILPCCGGIIGMGESKDDVVSLAFSIKKLDVDTIPVNFHIPVPGTPFADRGYVNPRYALKALCMFRFINPDREVRIAGGRELHLRSLQPLGLYPANAIFVSDYLTTQGQSPEDDYRMIEDLGFEIVRQTQ